MTADPACCSPHTALDQVAKLMMQNDCGQIPVLDSSNRAVGVVTDRDIVCRVVAEGKNPSAYSADSCMSTPVVTVRQDASIDDVIATMETHRIRRVIVVDADGCCVGIVAQADIATDGRSQKTAELVSQISQTWAPSGAPTWE
jgi:CBS domain-containing protein